MATILLAVSGSIAAYKAAELASKLKHRGHDVHVLMTASAQRLVQPNTFMNLTGNPVQTDLWDSDQQTRHIAITDRAELAVFAPATANGVAKLALGLADDVVSTTLLALACPLLVCPAMNARMWSNPVVQRNVAALRGLGHRVLEPAAGSLACGHVGPGRLPEPEDIAAVVEEMLAARAARPEGPAAELAPGPDIEAAVSALVEAGAAGGPGLFFELASYERTPSPEEVAAERAFRADGLARGALLASGPLGPTRWGHVHRAESVDAALELARRSPLSRGKCSIHVFPWDLRGGRAS